MVVGRSGRAAVVVACKWEVAVVRTRPIERTEATLIVVIVVRTT
jgi:hypothetical protein